MFQTGALTSVGDEEMKEIMGNGVVDVPNAKHMDLIKSNNYVKKQIETLNNLNCKYELRWTTKQARQYILLYSVIYQAMDCKSKISKSTDHIPRIANQKSKRIEKEHEGFK